MINKRIFLGSLLVAAVTVGFVGQSQAQDTDRVLAVSISLTGEAQAQTGVNTGKLAKVKFNNGAIINLALGQDPGTAVPATYTLANLVDCTNDGATNKLAVVDTSTTNVVVIVADTVPGRLDISGKKGLEAGPLELLVFNWVGSGNSNNTVVAGWLTFTGVNTDDPLVCGVQSITAKAGSGFLHTVSGGQEYRVVLSKGALVSGADLGKIVVEP